MENNKKTKVYVGGSLFTDKQITQRIREEELLKENFKNIDIYNPITNDEINDKTKQPTAKDIFLQDTTKIIGSDIITADLDDIDEGLAMELGVAYGVNYVLNTIENLIYNNRKIDRDSFRKILNSIPYKKILATYSDIRQDTKNENGIYKSVGKNQYVIGGIELMGKIHRHFEDVIKNLKESEEVK